MTDCDESRALGSLSSVSSAEPLLEEEEEEEEEDLLEETPTAQTRQERAAKGTLRCVSPFDIRFSQLRARAEFRDARQVQDAIEAIKVLPCDETAEESGVERPAKWLLEAPFPTIEVMRWRCKLRDPSTGRPRVDAKTGGELYASQEHLFALDNRRLYCLQRAAASVWPERAVVEVLDLPSGTPTRVRELKKFRTNDSGRSILIGGRGEGETLFRWSWRERVGVADDVSDVDGEDCPVHMRRRNTRTQRPSSWANGGKGPTVISKQDTFLERFSVAPYYNLCLFLGAYVALRVGGKVYMALRSPQETDVASILGIEDTKGVVVMLVRILMVVVIGFLAVSTRGARQ